MRKNGEGSITHMKNGKYRLRVQLGTKIVKDKNTGLPKKVKNTKDFFGDTEAESEWKYKEWKMNYDPSKNNEYENRLIVKCIYEWITKVKSLTLKTSSYSRLMQVTNDYVVPRFSVYKINEVTPDVIQFDLVNDLKEKGYSYSTIKKATNVLTGFFKWAVATRKVSYNPCNAVVLPSDKLIKEEKGVIDEVKYYSKEEIRKLQEAADSTDKNCYEVGHYRYPRAYVYLFIMYTGLRIGEIIALRWSDYDPEKKTITISKDVIEYKDPTTGKITTKLQTTPKTNSSYRVLALNSKAIETLEIIKRRSFNPDNEFIVANKKKAGKKDYIAPSNFRNAFRRFCMFAGVEYKGVHALRHTFASLMFAQGVDIKYISLWLGHSSVQVTYDIYVHVMEEMGYEKKNVIPEIEL